MTPDGNSIVFADTMAGKAIKTTSADNSGSNGQAAKVVKAAIHAPWRMGRVAFIESTTRSLYRPNWEKSLQRGSVLLVRLNIALDEETMREE